MNADGDAKAVLDFLANEHAAGWLTVDFRDVIDKDSGETLGDAVKSWAEAQKKKNGG